MTSYQSEGVIADIKREVNDIDRFVKRVLRHSKDKFNAEFFSENMLRISTQYIARMKKVFVTLRNDIHDFISLFNYKFTIDFDFLFQAIFGLYRLACYDNKFDLVMTLVYVIRTFLGSKLDQYMDIVCNWCDKFVLELKSYGKVKSEALPEFTPDLNLSKLFDLVLESNIMRSMRELILNLVGLKFFGRNMSNKFIATLGSPRPVSLIEFSRNLIITIEEFIQFSTNYNKTGSFMESLMKSDPVAAFLEETYSLTLEARNVYIGDDANFRTLERMRGNADDETQTDVVSVAAKDFIFKVRIAIRRGDEIKRSHKVSPAFTARMYILQNLLQDLAIKMRSKNRRAPFCLIVHGDPSIGKSSILVHIYKVFCKYKKLEYSRDLVYDRNPKSTYWTNHDPLSQPIIHYPELGSIASSIVKTKGDDTIDEMLMVADTQPYSAEMAAAEEKGKCMLMPELVVVDCNDPKMNLEYTNNNPAAIRRRFIYIEAKVKEEYATLTALDESKIPEDLENKMDLWTFNVYKQRPRGIKESIKEPIGTPNMDIFQMSSALFELFEEHDKKQDGFGVAVKENIDKYLVKAEAGPVGTIFLAWTGLVLCTFSFPMLTPFYFLSWISSSVVWDYMHQSMDIWLYAKLKITSYITKFFVWYKMEAIIDEVKLTSGISLGFAYLWCKNLFVEDLSYYEYKMKFTNMSTMKKYSLALLTFTITLAFIKIVCSIFEIVHSFTSEGNVIDSSGNFTEANVDDEIEKRERKAGCAFPVAKKKVQGDMDYDAPENIYPRVISQERNKKDPDQVFNSIKHNERHLQITHNGKTFRCRGMGIKGDYILVNKHCIPGDETYIVSSARAEWESNIKRVRIDICDTTQVGDDVVLFRFPGEIFRDITFSLMEPQLFNISLEGRFADAKKRVIQVNKPITVKNYYGDYTLNSSFKYEFPEHSNGDCGRPLMIIVNKQCFFVGIHSAGADFSADSFATIFDKTKVMKTLEIKSKDVIADVFSEGSLRLPKGRTIKPVTSKSPILYEDVPGLGVVGSISDYSNISPKTRLIKSPIVDEIEMLTGESAYREDGKMKFLPPTMKSKVVNGKYIAPYNVWVKKVGVVKNELPQSIMKVAITGLTCHLLRELKKKGVEKLTPYTLSVAQNGYPDNFYIRAMRNSTSGGFLLPGKKSRYNTPVELDFKKDSFMPIYDVKEQVLEILQAYENGEMSHDIVGAQLKDEPRTFDKAMSGKTRVFAMSSYPMTLVNRQYLMPFYALMVEHRDTFCTKVGINMHSDEAGKMYDNLLDFSPNIMEGDYGGYDTSMPVGVGLMSNSVVEGCLSRLGYNDYSMNIVRGILSDNLYPTLAMEGNIVVAAGFQPSGKYATAEDNSLRGLILLYFAYLTMCTEVGAGHEMNLTTKFGVNDFFLYFLPVTYGDDMVCAVKPVIADYFNNITYSEFVEKVYGMEFTTADKTAHTAKFIDPTKMSFLKRSFKFNPMLNRKVATLDKDSLVKSLSYILPSKEVGLEVQLVETCQSALRELFFHCESVEEYDAKRQQFISVLLKYTEFTCDDLEKLFPLGVILKDQYKQNVA